MWEQYEANHVREKGKHFYYTLAFLCLAPVLPFSIHLEKTEHGSPGLSSNNYTHVQAFFKDSQLSSLVK